MTTLEVKETHPYSETGDEMVIKVTAIEYRIPLPKGWRFWKRRQYRTLFSQPSATLTFAPWAPYSCTGNGTQITIIPPDGTRLVCGGIPLELLDMDA